MMKWMQEIGQRFQKVQAALIYIKSLVTGNRASTGINQRRSNSPRLVTPIGKLLDDSTYWGIAKIIIAALLAFSFYFYFLNPTGHGTNKALTWLDALYFSVITFSSLGYGDISPVGFGRLVAAIEVLFGLVAIAVLVGKLASERQSALLLLLYTSEHQRRILELVAGVQTRYEKVKKAFLDHNHDELFKACKDNYNSISSINNYLVYQSNEGRLAYSGNTSSLRKLYRALIEMRILLYQIIRTSHVERRALKQCEKALQKINLLSLAMIKFYEDDTETLALLTEIQNQEANIQGWYKLVASNNAKFFHRTEATDYLLKKIDEALAIYPWQDDIHIVIADSLNIGHKLALRSIRMLNDSKRATEPEK